MEAGRVVPDGAQWRVWLRHGTGYRDRGTAPQRSAAVMALLDAATRPGRGRQDGRLAATHVAPQPPTRWSVLAGRHARLNRRRWGLMLPFGPR